jgi:hypothetical protein
MGIVVFRDDIRRMVDEWFQFDESDPSEKTSKANSQAVKTAKAGLDQDGAGTCTSQSHISADKQTTEDITRIWW